MTVVPKTNRCTFLFFTLVRKLLTVLFWKNAQPEFKNAKIGKITKLEKVKTKILDSQKSENVSKNVFDDIWNENEFLDAKSNF